MVLTYHIKIYNAMFIFIGQNTGQKQVLLFLIKIIKKVKNYNLTFYNHFNFFDFVL